jgi:hypothetical protein
MEDLLSVGDVSYQTPYDGSQDFEGTANHAVLAAFINQLEGEKPPEGSFTKVIEIKEEKLLDFVNKERFALEKR